MVFIAAVIFIITSLKDTKPVYFLMGLLLSAIIYAALFLDYKFSSRAYGLGSYFMFPFYMILLPFIIGLVTKFSPVKYVKLISIVCFISVMFSGFFILFFNKYTLDIVDWLELPKYY
ncbi:hypothetical protein NU09_1514 [Flavobacterium beibuense]|uniref:Uncharacterized protein n=2 Tax=Flavobacterium beibuense TaxID=657326 RepID=A0A444WBJ8_9FLAO|nr:hypothetical protein NU09_1514 [Flavobacterium beibuense]